MQRTYMANNKIEKGWYVMDAQGKPLGRLAVEVARILRGKHRPEFTPHVDTGEHVIIINAEKVVLTGNKLQNKLYVRHSGYPGGMKTTNYATLMQTKPQFAVRKAVLGMLPHNRLGAAMLKKLRIYTGPEHPHQAQKPENWQSRIIKE